MKQIRKPLRFTKADAKIDQEMKPIFSDDEIEEKKQNLFNSNMSKQEELSDIIFRIFFEKCGATSTEY